MLGQAEVDGRNGGNGIHADALGMRGQFLTVAGVVAGDVGDHRDLTLGFGHDGFEQILALLHVLINALARRTANVQTVDALLDQIGGKGAGALDADVALLVLAGVECGENTLILTEI
jgi:hypothetical protein